MKAKQIYYHPRFQKAFLSLPKIIRDKTKQQEQIFRENIFDKRLKAHKLHGKLKNLWSFSVSGKHRVIFSFDGQDIIFYDIGVHEIYK